MMLNFNMIIAREIIVDEDKTMTIKGVIKKVKGGVDTKITKIMTVETIYYLEAELEEDSKITEGKITGISGKKEGTKEEEEIKIRKDNGREVIKMTGVTEVTIEEDIEIIMILEVTKAEVQEKMLRIINNFGVNLQVKIKV
jgi:hypothetical protein